MLNFVIRAILSLRDAAIFQSLLSLVLKHPKPTMVKTIDELAKRTTYSRDWRIVVSTLFANGREHFFFGVMGFSR